ncbi:MAG: flagellin [Desulfatitalea sp. BRH_c12]|nr:MAG: flagellin [Desulfatitalea sp. BRH_c12]
MAMNNITLTSGMRANLFSLQNTSKLMESTQTKLSSGKRVNSALDDPINFFAAQSHTQRASDLGRRKDEMSEAIQTIKAADNGLSAITDLIASAKSLAQSALATNDTSERTSLSAEFTSLMGQITDLQEDSGYKGTNLINDDVITVSFDESGDSTLTITGTSPLGDLPTAAGDWGNDTTATGATAIKDDIASLDTTRDTVRTTAKTLSSQLSTITIRQDFTTKMMNTLEDGAANLTNADLNEEGANMLMLQTRQSLGTTSLSLASQAAQSVMRLF